MRKLKTFVATVFIVLIAVFVFPTLECSENNRNTFFKAYASNDVATNISYSPVTGNADSSSLPSGRDNYYYGDTPYFNLQVGNNIFIHKAILYIYRSNGSLYTTREKVGNQYFRYWGQPVTFNDVGDFYSYFVLTYSSGSYHNSTGSFTTSQTSFSISDRTPSLNRTVSSVSLDLSGTKSSTIYFWNSCDVSYSYHYRFEADSSAYTCSWGEWDNDRAPLTIKANNTASNRTLTVYIIRASDSAVIAKTTVTINIQCTNHKYNAGSVTKAATCTSTGIKAYTCTLCGASKTSTISKTSHAYGSPSWTWSGTSSATAEFICSNCKTSSSQKATISSSNTKAATCTATGTRTYTAKVTFNDGTYTDKKSVLVSAKGHSYNGGNVIKSATCTTSGTKVYMCTSCKATKTEEITKLGHNYSTSWTTDKKATCEAKGIKSHHCTRCSAKKDATEIPLSNHNYDNGKVIKKATCTSDGSKTFTCALCEATKTKKVNKLGHNFSTSWTVDKKSTCKVKGIKSHHCTRCSAKKDVTKIKLAAHSLSSVVTKATTSNDGKITSRCSVCRKTVSTNKIYKIKSVVLSQKEYVFDSKVKTPDVVAKDSHGKLLKKGSDYKVSYSKGREEVGTYVVNVRFVGTYKGSKSLAFKIVLGKVSGLKQMKKEGINFKWNKVVGANGYQVFAYDTKAKKYLLLNESKGTALGNSSANGKMKIKVRAYRKVGSNVYYGAYSDVLVASAR